jgi:hypothetical protein
MSHRMIITRVFFQFPTDLETASYSAFCRNYGDHCTNKVGYRNWNKEALEGMTRDLVQSWQMVRGHVRAKERNTAGLISQMTDWVVAYLGE